MSAEALSVTGYYLFREEGKSRKEDALLYTQAESERSVAHATIDSMQGNPREVAA
jgi:hypothetical protein